MDRNRHEKGRPVSSDISLAEDWATALERLEAQRLGESRSRARSVVSRKTGVAIGTLYSLARKRLKTITNDTLRRLGNGLIAELVASRQKIRTALGLTPSYKEGGL